MTNEGRLWKNRKVESGGRGLGQSGYRLICVHLRLSAAFFP